MDAKPTRKVVAGTLAGAAVGVANWGLKTYTGWWVEPTPEILASVIVLVSAVAAWAMPEKQ